MTCIPCSGDAAPFNRSNVVQRSPQLTEFAGSFFEDSIRSGATPKSIAQLLIDPAIAMTHGRSHLSDDNPYSEAQITARAMRSVNRRMHAARFSALGDPAGVDIELSAQRGRSRHRQGVSVDIQRG